MNICFGTNENHLKYVAVVIKSILNTNKTPTTFHIFTDNISDDNKEKIETFKKENNANIIVHFNSDEIFKKEGLNHWRIESYKMKKAKDSGHYGAYYRLLIPSILKDEDKALYLDTDTLVVGDISELYNTNIKDKIFAVAKDFGWSKFGISRIRKLGKIAGIKKIHSIYFNSGVILFNIKRYNDLNIFEDAIEFLKFFKEMCSDQNALNYVTPQDEILLVDQKFNVLSTAKKREDAVVFHFATQDRKPWKRIRRTAIYQKWYETAKETPWWSEINAELASFNASFNESNLDEFLR